MRFVAVTRIGCTGEGANTYRVLTPGMHKSLSTYYFRNWLFLVVGRRVLKQICKKWDGGAWTGLVWLRIGTGGGLL